VQAASNGRGGEMVTASIARGVEYGA
jgi:hypothetical protein